MIIETSNSNKRMTRSSFVFVVRGDLRAGCIYVTLSYQPAKEAEAIRKAAKIATKRSADPNPELVNIVPPVR